MGFLRDQRTPQREWTTIPVPSNWELQGFGAYNYGQENVKSDEHGLYRLRFPVPADWKGRRVRLVFEGVMTDTSVKVNGRRRDRSIRADSIAFATTSRRCSSSARRICWKWTSPKCRRIATRRSRSAAATTGCSGASTGRCTWNRRLRKRSRRGDGCARRWHVERRCDARDRVRDADRLEGQVLAADGQPVGAAVFRSDCRRRRRDASGRRRGSNRRASGRRRRPISIRCGSRCTAAREALHTISERFGFRTFEVRKGRAVSQRPADSPEGRRSACVSSRDRARADHARIATTIFGSSKR